MHFVKEDDLQTMCLNVIATNIDKFVQRYPKWDDPEKSSKVIYFLRRVYSDTLYRLIIKHQGHISSGVLDLLLTPYWKKVVMPSSDYSHDGLFRRLKVMGKTITSLNLIDCTASSDMLTAIICCVPNVVFLNLVRTECSDSVLALISKTCKSLVSLNVGECYKVTNLGISHLCNFDRKEIGFNSLKALNISATRVSEEIIPLMLEYLSSLEYLSYKIFSCILYDLCYKSKVNLDSKYKLKSFEYYLSPSSVLPRYQDMSVYAVLRTWIMVCPSLTKIFARTKVTEQFLRLCSKFSDLKILKLESTHNPIMLCASDFFKLRAPQLTELNVTYVTMQIDIVIDLCVNLKKLTLQSVIFEDFDMPDTSFENDKLKKLEQLLISHADLGVKVVFKSIKALLCFSKNLHKFTLLYASNFHEVLISCIMNSNVTTLNVSFTDIKPKDLYMLFTSEKFKSICTDGCPYFVKKWPASSPGNTCAWKADFMYSDEILPNEVFGNIPWAGEYTI